MIQPIDLLRQELSKWEKALRKSEEFLEKGMININEHQKHRTNLMPKIRSYKHAIEVLDVFDKLCKSFG